MTKHRSSTAPSRHSKGSNMRKTNGRRPNNGRKGGNAGGHKLNINAVTSNRNRYLEKGKEAQAAGDRVEAEYCFQHADHFTRLIEEFNANKEKKEKNNNTFKEASATEVKDQEKQESGEPKEQQAPEQANATISPINASNEGDLQES